MHINLCYIIIMHTVITNEMLSQYQQLIDPLIKTCHTKFVVAKIDQALPASLGHLILNDAHHTMHSHYLLRSSLCKSSKCVLLSHT